MRRRLTTAAIWPLLAVIGIGPVFTTLAQTPEANPVATPLASESPWAITETRDIEVDGEPYVLSPDGRWLAGIRWEGSNEVCAWNVANLTSTCVEVEHTVLPFPLISEITWAPDSTAFAFIMGSIAFLDPTNVMVFDVNTGDVVNLTQRPEVDPQAYSYYVGTAWTNDSQQVVFGVNEGDVGNSDRILHVERTGGILIDVPLPDWSAAYRIHTAPVMDAGNLVYFSVQSRDDSDGAFEGIWRIELDGSEPVLLVPAGEDAPVVDPLVVSVSADGRHVHVASEPSLFGWFRPNETFFLLEVETGNLTSDGEFLPAVLAPVGGIALVGGLLYGAPVLAIIHLMTGDIESVLDIANGVSVGENWRSRQPTWAENDTVFIPTDDGGVLLTLENTP